MSGILIRSFKPIQSREIDQMNKLLKVTAIKILKRTLIQISALPSIFILTNGDRASSFYSHII